MMEQCLPIDITAERAVLGSILLEREAIVAIADQVHPTSFYLEKHAWIYTAALACYERRVPPDLTTVADALRRHDRLTAVGGMAFLGELAAEAPTALHVEYYAQIVARTATLRRLIAAGGEIAALGYREDQDLDATIQQAEATLLAAMTDQVESIAEAEQMAETLSEDVIKATGSLWQAIVQQLQHQVIGIYQAEGLLPRAEREHLDLAPSTERLTHVSNLLQASGDHEGTWDWVNNTDWLSTAKVAIREGPLPPTIYILGGMLTFIPGLGVVAPILPALTLSANIVVGWQKAQRSQLEDVKQELVRYSVDIQSSIQHSLLEPSHESLQESVLHTFFEQWQQQLDVQLQALIDRASAELDAEERFLAGRETFDAEQRSALLRHSEVQLDEWTQLGRTIKAILTDLQQIDRQLSVATADLRDFTIQRISR